MGMNSRRVWLMRALIGGVTFWNLLAAFQFLIAPELYSAGFELSGAAGLSLVRGMGVLFVMWNVPYVAALINPARNRTSLVEAVIMQVIGFVGESVLKFTLTGFHPVLQQTVSRFMLFDGAGVVLLALAWALGLKRSARPSQG